MPGLPFVRESIQLCVQHLWPQKCGQHLSPTSVLSPCHVCLDPVLTFARPMHSPRHWHNPRSMILRCCYGMQQLERLAKGAVSLNLALSLIAARADILWIGNSPLLNYCAGQKKRKQTVWLRRILLLEVGCSELSSRAAQAILVITNAPAHNAHHALLVPNSHVTHLNSFASQQQHAGLCCICSDTQQPLSCSPHTQQPSHAKYVT